MNTIALNVTGNRLRLPTPSVLTGGSANVDRCTFVFDSAWADFSKLAVFASEDGGERPCRSRITAA